MKKERHISFSNYMVRAILNGHKTQTRRIVKWKESKGGLIGSYSGLSDFDFSFISSDGFAVFNAIGESRHLKCPYKIGDTLWVKKTFMASRIALTVTSVKVERLNDITESDAIKEGVSTVDSYRSLWEKRNGKGSWALNPFVWVLSFDVVVGRKK